MGVRPLYVGIGECRCGRIDTRLYFIPTGRMLPEAVCVPCLEARGFQEPEPRTEQDLITVDGKLEWKMTDATTRSEQMHLGHGHTFEAITDKDEQLIGWLHTHPDARNPRILCQSFCAVRPLNGAPVHQVLCADPLTLTPSLQCRMCGAHGNVTDGKWEPR